ncbi:YegS/Rv2252/BmrU family lipid kinase [soil metagenome]
MPTLALISNPDSGSGEADRVAKCLRGHGVEVREFALDDVDAAVASEPDRVAVAGGDGSIACVAAPAARAGIPLAVIATGTANDFARELGLPRDTEEACELVATGERIRRLDLAWMGDRAFLNVAGLGLPPAAARQASGLKSALGPLAYTVGALRAGLRARPVRCVVRCDGEEVHAGEAWQVTVASTGAFGAGSSIPAEPGDGKLDVVVIEARSRARLAVHAYGLRSGSIGKQEGVVKQRCAQIEIELEELEPFNVDGEVVESGSCGFRVDPQVVELIVP